MCRERCYPHLRPWVCVGDARVSSVMTQSLPVLSSWRSTFPPSQTQLLRQVPSGSTSLSNVCLGVPGSPKPQPQTKRSAEGTHVPCSGCPSHKHVFPWHCRTFVPERTDGDLPTYVKNRCVPCHEFGRGTFACVCFRSGVICTELSFLVRTGSRSWTGILSRCHLRLARSVAPSFTHPPGDIPQVSG